MCHQPLSDKGWLRQYWPQHRSPHLEHFIGLIVKRLNYCPKPTARQLEAVRQAAYRDMTGAVK
ncbi:hypothetical protein V3O24_04485 [Methylobacter sp. Wu8]|uniref:hypothetical protein n=1 Tax=Methylobacter sp. Wu8 TaxID=3118457 RepID=UPI002F30FC32